ncbi:DUF1631 domain-containing protein [Oceanicoccus sp. KOV_DT_Chl]|uniref:DUF1631 domain-containing protein n=1 Tax=Oceanicoccus sp. KOV_DT_Chl TaxID=1904639 RepID=UPI000C7D6B86|nr:DUF1631 domain-containing protein [Oceanicoccus sp. KOV_DT_Chl]
MVDTKNVVKLSDHAAKTSDPSALLVRLPAPFAQMKDKGKQSLQPLLQSLFDNIDDALFELADRAEANAEQNMYFESMREVRIKRRGMELAFGKGIDSAFATLLASPNEPPVLNESAKISTESWSLVNDDELEELVASDNMVAKAERQFALELKQLTTRLNTLIISQDVTEKNNPFSPAVICQSFIDICKSLELDIKAKLVLFKLFDRYVMSGLSTVYKCCNDILVDGGIMPNIEQQQNNGAKKPTNAVAAEQAQAQSSTNTDVFSDLQNLLHHMPQVTNTNASSGLVAPGQAPQIPRETLLQLLQAVQKSLLGNMENQLQSALQGVGPQQLDVQQYLSSILNAKMPNKALSIGQIDDDAINLVAMLFQFILDDRNLAPPMKALIARLQIPIIKVAMQDKSFFSKGGHPARKLLNEIANASLGWVPTANIDRDPLYKKVSDVIGRIVAEYDGSNDLFPEVLADFMAFQEMDQRRINLVEQRTINAEDGRAKSEAARNRVQAVLNEKVAGKELPVVVVTLLEQAWSNVLFLICLKEGEETNQWQQALEVVDDLLWTVQPVENTESRQKLLAMMPKLLERLRAGLTRISFDPFEMNQLFTDLEVIHLNQLQSFKQQGESGANATTKVAKQQTIAKQNRAIEQTLDQMLDGRDAGKVSLEQLDAELDQQLAEFDALGDLVASAAEEFDPQTPKMVKTEAPAQTADAKLERRVVEKLVVNGASEDTGAVIESLSADDPCLQQVDAMSTGLWMELYQDDGKKFRCRLAAIIRATNKYIFVNRSGMKVAEYTRMSLAVAMKKEQIGMLDDGQLFDRALESVIGNLRNMKTGNG